MAMQIDWEQIRYEFENTSKSGRLIAREFGVSPGGIRRNAKIEKWKKFDSSVVADDELTGSLGNNPILKKIAIRKILEIRDELGEEYSAIDEPLIIMYATNYQMWIELQLDIAENGIVSISSKGSTYMSAEFMALKSVEKTIVNISNQLGLSVAARKKLKMSTQKDSTKSLFDLDAEIAEMEVDF